MIEQTIAPIPSLAVLVPAGIIAEMQSNHPAYIIVLAGIAAAGRLVGALILYLLADKIEDILLVHRTFFGIKHADLERVGKQLSNSWRDWLILFFLNAFPFTPPGVVAIGCGFLKVRMRLFVITTFFGAIISALLYLYLGYSGVKITEALRNIELIGQITIGAVLVITFILFLVRHYQNSAKVR